MAQKFPYEKASIVIAEADIFGDKQILKRWGINQSTLWRWRDRAQGDAKLHESALLKKRMLLVDWQTDATKTLKTGLNKLGELINEDGRPEQIHAVAGAVKIVGELKIQYSALIDEPTFNQQNQQSEAN